MAHRPDHSNKHTLEKLETFATSENSVKILTFDTWSRVLNGIKKSSLLDHIYVKNLATVLGVSFNTPPCGDHVLVIARLNSTTFKQERNSTLKRNWKNYKESGLNSDLLTLVTSMMSNNNVPALNVQKFWNCLENVLINAVDKHAPLLSTHC